MTDAMVSDDQLRAAVAGSRSWRGVLRSVGLPEASSRHGRLLRARCDALGVGYAHFSGQRRWSDASLAAEIAEAATWSELLQALGYSEDNGSARATIRAHSERLGLDVSRLNARDPDPPMPPLVAGLGAENLRMAGPTMVSACLMLAGHRVSWPLEPAAYDLVVDIGSTPLVRVQVKTTTQRQGDTWLCSVTRATYMRGARWRQRQIYNLEEIDYFGIVDGDLAVYLIPARVLGGLSAISLRKYQRFRIGSFAVVAALKPDGALHAGQSLRAPAVTSTELVASLQLSLEGEPEPHL